jgi:spermidine synthase
VSSLLWLCFWLSGAGALALELLWLRSAGLVLGTTAQTAATVVSATFAGLALGGYLARTAPRAPVRRYGRLELVVAAGALLSLAVFRLLSTATAQQGLARGGPVARIALVALTILPAAAALGATLPTLTHALATAPTVGRRGGALYALNTLGGVCGIAAMGFGLPLAVGVGTSYAVAAAANGLAGLLALWIGDGPPPSAPPAAREVAPGPRVLPLVAAGTGLLGIGLEILWTVLFAQILHNSVYSFAAVSLVFLLSIAVGAEISALLLRRLPAARVAAGGLIGAAIGSVGGVWAFVYWTGGLGYFGMETGLPEYVARIVALAAVTEGPGTIAAGAVLPALWSAYGERLVVARTVGELTALNLLGGVVGALLAGFVALPWIGLRAAFLLAGVAYVLLAQALTWHDPGLRRLGYGCLLAIALLDPMHLPLTHLDAGETLRVIRESASGIVTVVDTGDDLQLRLDNYYVLGGSAAETTERRQGLLPLLLHPRPQRVAFIGMATGISASAAVALRVPDTTVIELVPDVAALARAHFSAWNARLLDQPGVHLIVDDARRHLTAATSSFDVIVSDLFIPWHASAGSLYSREMYETVARRLAEGGLFCQWLPLYQLTREEFAVIARTFLGVFPHVTLWRNDFYPDRPVLGLIGTSGPLPVDLDRVGASLSGLPEWSRDSFLTEPRAVAMLYLGDLSMTPDLFARAPVNRDDRPIIEFLAPRLTRVGARGDKDWFVGDALADFTDDLADRLSGAIEPTLPPTEAARDARRAGRALFRYALAARTGERAEAERQMAEVRGLVPEVVSSGDRAGPAPALAEARRTLGALRTSQEQLRRQVESLEHRLRPTAREGEHRP